jgi:co-chaperonin GroES (HSP10)
MKIQGKGILVLPDDNPNATSKGILIPKTVKEKPKTGKVIDIGPGCKDVNIGDAINYERKGASVINLDGVEHHFIIEDQVYYYEREESK